PSARPPWAWCAAAAATPPPGPLSALAEPSATACASMLLDAWAVSAPGPALPATTVRPSPTTALAVELDTLMARAAATLTEPLSDEADCDVPLDLPDLLLARLVLLFFWSSAEPPLGAPAAEAFDVVTDEPSPLAVKLIAP